MRRAGPSPLPYLMILPSIALALWIIGYPIWDVARTSVYVVNRFGQLRGFAGAANFEALFSITRTDANNSTEILNRLNNGDIQLGAIDSATSFQQFHDTDETDAITTLGYINPTIYLLITPHDDETHLENFQGHTIGHPATGYNVEEAAFPVRMSDQREMLVYGFFSLAPIAAGTELRVCYHLASVDGSPFFSPVQPEEATAEQAQPA